MNYEENGISVRKGLTILGIFCGLACLFLLSLWIGLTFDLPFYDNLNKSRNAFSTGLVAVTQQQVEPVITMAEPPETVIESDPVTDDTTQAEDAYTAPVYPVSRPIVVCIDPGHGYDDPGTSSQYLGAVTEKEINLAVSLILRDKLTAAGYTVIMTRSDDVIPADHDPDDGFYLMNPYARESFVKSQDLIDLYISVHCNAMPQEEDKAVNGTEIYYYLENSDLTLPYAKAVSQAIQDVTGREPHIAGLSYDEAYYVTKAIPMPSILVEMGYVTNPDDAAALLSAEFRNAIAQGMAQGIISFSDDNLIAH